MTKPTVNEVKLADITIDPEVNIRHRLDKDTVKQYVDVFDSLPPPIVYRDGRKKELVLADGFHRCEAAKRLKRETVFVVVESGTRADALEHAALANLNHGRNLTLAERDAAIARLYAVKDKDGKRKWAQRPLAEKLGMSQQAVQLALKSDKGSKTTGDQTASRGDVAAVSGLPEEQAKALLDLKESQSWSRDELQAAARTLADDEVDDAYKANMLAGKSPPLAEGNEVPVATITRVVNTSDAGSPLRPLWRAMEGVSVLRGAHDPDAVAQAATAYNLDMLSMLQEDIAYLESVAAALAVSTEEGD
jgi:hypothetical protein